MAEPEKADERWIVKEREDGRNVNSWHWEEKQRLPWARERLGALLLVSAVGGGDEGGGGGGEGGGSEGAAARITKVRDVTGEALTTTRKGGKRFAVYDLRVTAAWSVGGGGEGGGGGGKKKRPKPKEEQEEEEEGGDDDDDDEDDDAAAPAARTGTVTIEELASTHEPDDYVVTFKADGGSAEDARARDAAQRLLTAPLLAALEAFCREIAAL